MTLARSGPGRPTGEGNFRFQTLLRWISRMVETRLTLQTSLDLPTPSPISFWLYLVRVADYWASSTAYPIVYWVLTTGWGLTQLSYSKVNSCLSERWCHLQKTTALARITLFCHSPKYEVPRKRNYPSGKKGWNWFMAWIKSWKTSNKEGLGKRSSQGKMSDKARVGWIIKRRLFKTFFQPPWGFHCW